MSFRNPPAVVLIGIGLSAVAGCDGIVDPPWWTHQIVIYAALNPDSTQHPITIAATDYESTLFEAAVSIHRRVESGNGEEWEQVAAWDSAQAAASGRSLRDLMPCRSRIGRMSIPIGGVDQVCMTPEADLEPGVYRVEARARDRETASGVTRVVGSFEINDAVVRGPDDSAELSAVWTPSLAAHRYIVSLRKATSDCDICADGWHADVDATTITTAVPEDAIKNAFQDPMMLDVMALDEHLHAFLTTGHSGLAFSVPPVQNVEGGFGVVGSLRFRDRRVERMR